MSRIEIVESGATCLLKLSILELQCQIEVTDEELFLLAVEAAKTSARRIRHKDYANAEILQILRRATEDKA